MSADVYKRTFTSEKKTSLRIPAGDGGRCFAVRAPGQGSLTGLLVRQGAPHDDPDSETFTTAGFTVTPMTEPVSDFPQGNEQGDTFGEHPLYPRFAVPNVPKQFSQITAPAETGAGNLANCVEEPETYACPTDKRLRRAGVIWVEIALDAPASEDTFWELFYEVEME